MRRLYTRIYLHFLGVLVVVALVASAAFARGWRPGSALWLVGLLFLVGMVAGKLARRISRPIERLIGASRRFGAGDLSVRLPTPPRTCPPGGHHHRHHRTDEIVELTRAWNDMAERIQVLVDGQRELLANVSHELRSPLARIRVALELLPVTPEVKTRVAEVARDLAELDRLIEDVLTTSRLQATGLPSHLESVDVRALTRELAQRAGSDPAVAGRAVAADDGEPLPIVADAALLRRALWNLVENAAKYGAPPITLAAAAHGGLVRLTVSDEGAGIPPAEREHVFTPFYRADRARTPGAAGPRGYGLGLTFARRVAEVHGGRIAVEAARVVDGQERGCVVVLELPLQP